MAKFNPNFGNSVNNTVTEVECKMEEFYRGGYAGLVENKDTKKLVFI